MKKHSFALFILFLLSSKTAISCDGLDTKYTELAQRLLGMISRSQCSDPLSKKVLIGYLEKRIENADQVTCTIFNEDYIRVKKDSNRCDYGDIMTCKPDNIDTESWDLNVAGNQLRHEQSLTWSQASRLCCYYPIILRESSVHFFAIQSQVITEEASLPDYLKSYEQELARVTKEDFTKRYCDESSNMIKTHAKKFAEAVLKEVNEKVIGDNLEPIGIECIPPDLIQIKRIEDTQNEQ